MNALRWSTMTLLAFLGLSAVVGAVPMLLDPTGRLSGMPLILLAHSPFASYLVPGIVLLVANGLFALFVLLLAFRRKPSYGALTVFQGAVLLGWIVMECLMIRLVIWAHYLYAAVALALILFGAIQWRAASRRPVIWTL